MMQITQLLSQFFPFNHQEVGIYGDHFQGDMILTEEQISALFSTTLSGQVSTKYRWPNGIVSYVIESKYTEKERKKLLDAMKDIESVSCIKFVERTTEKDYIEIVVSFFNFFRHISHSAMSDQIIASMIFSVVTDVARTLDVRVNVRD